MRQQRQVTDAVTIDAAKE